MDTAEDSTGSFPVVADLVSQLLEVVSCCNPRFLRVLEKPLHSSKHIAHCRSVQTFPTSNHRVHQEICQLVLKSWSRIQGVGD